MKWRHLVPCLLLLVSFSSHAALIHQYRLDGTLADDLGGPALIARGGTLGPAGYAFGANKGLTLQANLGSVYTIDLVYNFASNALWQKIIDFRNLGYDHGVYTHTGTTSLFPAGSGGTAGQVQNGVDSQLTLTRDATGAVKAYVNKKFAFGFTDSTAYMAFNGNPAHFFIDDRNGSEASAGAVQYIRTFDNAMTAADVAALAAVEPPPSANVPEPASAALMLAGLGLLTVARRRQRASALAHP